jgi:hypothetical protein
VTMMCIILLVVVDHVYLHVYVRIVYSENDKNQIRVEYFWDRETERVCIIYIIIKSSLLTQVNIEGRTCGRQIRLLLIMESHLILLVLD